MIIISLLLLLLICFTIVLTIIIIINHIRVNQTKNMAVGYLPPFLKEVLVWLVVYLPR